MKKILLFFLLSSFVFTSCGNDDDVQEDDSAGQDVTGNYISLDGISYDLTFAESDLVSVDGENSITLLITPYNYNELAEGVTLEDDEDYIDIFIEAITEESDKIAVGEYEFTSTTDVLYADIYFCLLYTSPSPRDA